MDKIRVIFFGTPEFVVPVLDSLINNGYSLSAVFAGKGPLAQIAEKHGIKVFQPASLKKDEKVFKEFKNLKPDICIVAAYGKIIPKNFLKIPRHGFLNIHPSLLPKYRGPSPIQTVILNGDFETGVSLMIVDEELDHGPILASQEFPISNFQFSNHDELAKELFRLGGQLLLETLPEYLEGKLKPLAQDHDQATFTKMFERKDGRINWSEPGDKIYNQIRALNPEPGTWTMWPARRSLGEGGKGKVLNIIEVEKTQRGGATGDPMSAQGILAEHSWGEERQDPVVIKLEKEIAVTTKKCYLILKSIQLEGGKVMDAKSFVNGHPDFLNSKLE